jgi:hypothetical protein
LWPVVGWVLCYFNAAGCWSDSCDGSRRSSQWAAVGLLSLGFSACLLSTFSRWDGFKAAEFFQAVAPRRMPSLISRRTDPVLVDLAWVLATVEPQPPTCFSTAREPNERENTTRMIISTAVVPPARRVRKRSRSRRPRECAQARAGCWQSLFLGGARLCWEELVSPISPALES